MKAIKEFNINDYSFENAFKKIINDKRQGYSRGMAGLKSFLEDMQRGGCVSGMIGDFVYHNDCRKFYIKHIDDLYEYKGELENAVGEAICDNQFLPQYTFIVWLCFEEYCNQMYRDLFEE